MLAQVCGTEGVSRKCVYDWFKRFRDGKETTEDEPRSGRPSTSRTPDMIEQVRQMLQQDRRVTLRLMAEELGISKDRVHTTIRKDLGRRKICSWFVPHKLTEEQKAKRMKTSGDGDYHERPVSILSANHRHRGWDLVLPVRSGIQAAIDGMESTVFPATQKESPAKSPKSRQCWSHSSTAMASSIRNSFLRVKPWIPHSTKKFWNGCYNASNRVRPESHTSGQWMLVHDNAPAHCAIRVHQFLAQRGVRVLHHPPSSPDVAPADFFLFPRLKSIMKGARFADVAAIQERATAVLRSILKEAFADSFLKLCERCQKCVVKDGDYFEGK